MTIDTLEGAVLVAEPDEDVGGQLDDPAGFPSGRGSEGDPIPGGDLSVTVDREPEGGDADAEKDQPPAWLLVVLIAGAAFLIHQSFRG